MKAHFCQDQQGQTPNAGQARGFTLIEILIAGALITLFAAGAISAMSMTNTLAARTRALTQARTILSQTLNETLQTHWSDSTPRALFDNVPSEFDVTDPAAPPEIRVNNPVRLYYFDRDGNPVDLPATVLVGSREDPDGIDTVQVYVQVTYTMNDLAVTMETTSIKAKGL